VRLITPCPRALAPGAILDHLAPAKDVEGLTPRSLGLMTDGRPRFIPATAEAIMAILRFYEVEVAGQHVTVVGRSRTVGRPAAILLLHADATVTVTHSRTSDLARHTRGSAVVVAASGVPGLITGDMIAAGATGMVAGVH